MQLPGMATDPIRVSTDVTWWPPLEEFSFSRRIWTRPSPADAWVLEDLATSASPIRLVDLPDRWGAAHQESLRLLMGYFEVLADPFG